MKSVLFSRELADCISNKNIAIILLLSDNLIVNQARYPNPIVTSINDFYLPMDHSTTAADNSFGITSSTLLDSSYLDSLFSSDPAQIAAIAEPEAAEPDASSEEKKKQAPSQQKPAPEPVNTEIEQPDFLDKLSDLSEEQPEESAPKAAPPKPADQSSPLQEKPPTTTEQPSQVQSNIADFGRELYHLGVLSPESDGEPLEIKSVDDLKERLFAEKQRGAVQLLENILGHFGPEYREAFDAIYIDGVHPRDYFVQAEELSSLQDLDLAVVENQKYVLRTHYRSLGWDAAKIAAKIEKLENYQDLEEEARDLHVALVAKEKQALESRQTERKQELTRKATLEQQHQQAIGKLLQDKTKAKDFDGIPFDEKTARSLSAYMLEKKWQLGENQISDFEKEILDLSRPENRELQVKVALLMHLIKTDPTLARLQRKAVTKETDKIFSFLQREETAGRKQDKKRSSFFDD